MDEAAVQPDPGHDQVDMLVVFVAVLDGHPLQAIEVVSHPLEVVRRDARQLRMGQMAIAWLTFPPWIEGEGCVDNGLFDVGAKLSYGSELAGQVPGVLPGHVPAHDLGLVLGCQGVCECAPEA
jgi:hypothetical protein